MSVQFLRVEGPVLQLFDVEAYAPTQRFEIHTASVDRKTLNLLEPAPEHLRRAFPQTASCLVVADGDLNQPQHEIPELIGHAIKPILEHLVGFEISAGVELARRIDHQASQRVWRIHAAHTVMHWPIAQKPPAPDAVRDESRVAFRALLASDVGAQ